MWIFSPQFPEKDWANYSKNLFMRSTLGPTQRNKIKTEEAYNDL